MANCYRGMKMTNVWDEKLVDKFWEKAEIEIWKGIGKVRVLRTTLGKIVRWEKVSD